MSDRQPPLRVLIVDDAKGVRTALAHGLRKSGVSVRTAASGQQGLALARAGGHDVIILDRMLPDIDGLTVLRRLREEGDLTHVLLLTARDQLGDRIEGLQEGADDYMTKPFSFAELLARVRALARRNYGTQARPQLADRVQLDNAAMSILLSDRRVPLTPREHAVMRTLIQRRGEYVTKAEILAQLTTGKDRPSVNAVEVLVHEIRNKIARAGGRRDLIRTGRGRGYLLE